MNEIKDIGVPDAALEKLADADAFRFHGAGPEGSIMGGIHQRPAGTMFGGQPSREDQKENLIQLAGYDIFPNMLCMTMPQRRYP